MDPLRALTNPAGVAFANFPPTFRALANLTGYQMGVFLNHYELPPGGSNRDRIQRIKKFIGMGI
jgi:hypothetical protein